MRHDFLESLGCWNSRRDSTDLPLASVADEGPQGWCEWCRSVRPPALASWARHFAVTTYFVPFATLTSIGFFSDLGNYEASFTTKTICDYSMTLPKALLMEPGR